MRYLPVLYLSFCCLFAPQVSFAQPTASVAGYVRDAVTEEPLVGVAVQLQGTALGSTTDTSGYYSISNVPPDSYNITASYVGYQSLTLYKVVVRSAGTPDVNFQLQEAVSQLQNVEIRANPFQIAEETPLSVQRLSQEEVATYPGGNNDIAKVVQSLPGVSGSVGGFRNDVIIRGGAPNENVYYLDGIEIPNINHFATQGSAGGPVGLLNVSFFEGVTLSTSSFGAQYDNVLSGVLQFDQRDGDNRDYKGNIRIGASEAALTAEGPLFKGDKDGSNTSFIASVRRSYLQFLFKVIGLPFLPDYWDYQYKLSHKFSAYDELIFTGIGSIDDFSINQPSDFDAEQQAILDQVPVIRQWTGTSGLSWKHRLKGYKGYMITSLSSNILNNNFRQFEDNEAQAGLYFSNDAREWESRLRYSYHRFIRNGSISAGGSGQWVHYTNRTRNLVNGFDYDNALSFLRYGFFGQMVRSFFGEKLSLTGGFRFDGNTFTDTGNQVYRTFSPRFAASLLLDDAKRWTLNASAGRYYKIPPYTILGFQNTRNVLVNQDAAYIRSDHLVGGIAYLLAPSARITLEGFYKKYSNYPVSLTDSVSLANLGGDFEVLGNEPVASVGLGRSYGLELLIQQKFTGRLYAILAATLYKSEYTGFDPDRYLPSVWDNGQLLTFTGGYKFGNNWELGLRVRYLGPAPYAPVDAAATLENYPAVVKDYQQLGRFRTEAFNQTDVRLDKKWNFKSWTLDVYLDIQNILGSTLPGEPLYGLDRDEQGEILLPRNLVEVREVANNTILPTIGLVVNF